MRTHLFVIWFHLLINLYYCAGKNIQFPYNHTKPNSRFDNPNFVKDRYKNEILKPQMPEYFSNRHRKPFNPAWMDYCDPYHCNDYHKSACGLNRKNMKFKWFQSGCHIILNNMCSNYRGSLKYDMIDPKFCNVYVMHLRSGCSQYAEDCDDGEPICAINMNDGQLALFRSACSLQRRNCKSNFMQEFEEVHMTICDYHFNKDRLIVD